MLPSNTISQKWWTRWDLNPRPFPCHGNMLSTTPQAHLNIGGDGGSQTLDYRMRTDRVLNYTTSPSSSRARIRSIFSHKMLVFVTVWTKNFQIARPIILSIPIYVVDAKYTRAKIVSTSIA